MLGAEGCETAEVGACVEFETTADESDGFVTKLPREKWPKADVERDGVVVVKAIIVFWAPKVRLVVDPEAVVLVVVEMAVVDGWLEVRPKLKLLLAAVVDEVVVAAAAEVTKDRLVDVFEVVPKSNPVLDVVVIVVGTGELNEEVVGAVVAVLFEFKAKNGVDWALVLLEELERPNPGCDKAVALPDVAAELTKGKTDFVGLPEVLDGEPKEKAGVELFGACVFPKLGKFKPVGFAPAWVVGVPKENPDILSETKK